MVAGSFFTTVNFSYNLQRIPSLDKSGLVMRPAWPPRPPPRKLLAFLTPHEFTSDVRSARRHEPDRSHVHRTPWLVAHAPAAQRGGCLCRRGRGRGNLHPVAHLAAAGSARTARAADHDLAPHRLRAVATPRSGGSLPASAGAHQRRGPGHLARRPAATAAGPARHGPGAGRADRQGMRGLPALQARRPDLPGHR